MSGGLSTPSGRRKVNSLHFRIGSGGTVNEPLPNTDYILYIDNITLQKKRYKTNGKIISKPILIGMKTDGFEWIGDYVLPKGTKLQFESRTGSTNSYDSKTWEDWKPIDISSLFEGKISSTPDNYIQHRVIFYV